jgi:hypothetical protein
MKKILFFIGLTAFFFLQSMAQREFGLGIQSGLTESSISFWSWLGLFIFLSLILKALFVGLWLWSWSSEGELPSLTDFNYAIRENIRSLGSVLTYGLFFVLPGFYRYLELYWVVWIVYLNPEYKNGTLDALRESRRLWKLTWKKVLSLVLVFDILLPLIIEAILGVDSYSSTVNLDTFIYSLAISFSSVVTGFFVYRIFQKNRDNKVQ